MNPVEYKICKYELNDKCEVQCLTVGKATQILTVEEMIKDDKRYGNLKPRNGKHFTFKVIDMPQEELPRKTIVKAVQHGLNRLRFHTQLSIKQKKTGDTDLTIIGRTPKTDERDEMSINTIMYAYYPITALSSKDRGIIVVNTDFDFTVNGISVPLPTGGSKKTIDLDQVFGHEFGHSFGFPHDQQRQTLMNPYENHGSEFSSDRDIARFQAKLGKTTRSVHLYKRIMKWFRHRSDHY